MKDDVIGDYLQELLKKLQDNSEGEVAAYIPELAAADPEPFAVAFCTNEGQVYAEGLREGDSERRRSCEFMVSPTQRCSRAFNSSLVVVICAPSRTLPSSAPARAFDDALSTR